MPFPGLHVSFKTFAIIDTAAWMHPCTVLPAKPSHGEYGRAEALEGLHKNNNFSAYVPLCQGKRYWALVLFSTDSGDVSWYLIPEGNKGKNSTAAIGILESPSPTYTSLFSNYHCSKVIRTGMGKYLLQRNGWHPQKPSGEDCWVPSHKFVKALWRISGVSVYINCSACHSC